MYCIGIRLEELNKTTETLKLSVISGQIRIGRLLEYMSGILAMT
jgi:hypothetical protein